MPEKEDAVDVIDGQDDDSADIDEDLADNGLDEDLADDDSIGEGALADDTEAAGEDDDEDEDATATDRPTRTTGAGEDDEDEPDPDDVEADLDTILRDRIAAGDDDEDEEEEEKPSRVTKSTPDDATEGGNRVAPRKAGEFVCASCFLVKPNMQLADPKKKLCLDCV
jgi:hypothetical protein